jgi:hypothetical protein
MKKPNYITMKPNFSKICGELDKKYFPNVKYYRDDVNCTEVHYATELFNNGCLGYETYINRLTMATKSSKKEIHAIVSKYVEDFGDFKFKV